MTEQNIPIPEGFDIYWEKWVDAYSTEEIEDLQPTAEEIEYNNNNPLNDSFMDDMPLYSVPIKTIMTPFGVLPLTETSLASKHFKFWVGHANFRLFEDYIPVIEQCDGVESVDILTPYRFKIGIGLLFQDRQVMNNVRAALLGAIE